MIKTLQLFGVVVIGCLAATVIPAGSREFFIMIYGAIVLALLIGNQTGEPE